MPERSSISAHSLCCLNLLDDEGVIDYLPAIVVAFLFFCDSRQRKVRKPQSCEGTKE